MAICCLCDVTLTPENDSGEHLIANSIGGQLVVWGVLCKSCNGITGETWDAGLARELLPLCHLFSIVRDRGESPPLKVKTTADERLTILPGGRLRPTDPTVQISDTPDGKTINIQARDRDELRTILKGLQRKFPQVNVEEAMHHAQVRRAYPEGIFHYRFPLGGPLSGRSLVKSAVVAAHWAGIPWTSCADAIAYLRDSEAAATYGFYNETDLVEARPAETPLHCVSVRANPESGLILAYIEFFGLHRVVSCLGRDYGGPAIERTYSIDPRTGEALDLKVRLDFDADAINEIYDYKRFKSERMQDAAALVFPAALQRQADAERDDVIGHAVDRAFATCGAQEGDILTEDHVQKSSRTMIEELMPFILHRLKRTPRQ